MQQLASEISARIANLESLFDEPLRHEMDSLKECLLANPSASALLLDTDIGLLVKNLRRTVTVAVEEAAAEKTAKKPAKTKVVKLTADLVMQAKEEGFPD